ncbi:DgyrCDS10405 [Dimorphilus gyrociliatus]|uniref:DgyrCDS10405 n=1 Tax=Dimorphilus gyrociliatus TaxID=2664684 RepID=A0A7I8W582_9ANNE|nr:DgyrCDS10405 [Dimorphilus gyrociliatus]
MTPYLDCQVKSHGGGASIISLHLWGAPSKLTQFIVEMRNENDGNDVRVRERVSISNNSTIQYEITQEHFETNKSYILTLDTYSRVDMSKRFTCKISIPTRTDTSQGKLVWVNKDGSVILKSATTLEIQKKLKSFNHLTGKH